MAGAKEAARSRRSFEVEGELMSTTRTEPHPTLELAETDPRLAAYLAEPRPLPRSSVDSQGRLISLSDEERAARSRELRRTLETLPTLTDETDTEETWAAVFRGIDEGRPRRKQFGGMD